MSDLGTRFLEARHAHSISLRKAAEQAGIPLSAVRRMKRAIPLSPSLRARVEEWIESLPSIESDPDEEWRTLPGWENHYEVSNLGQVRSVSRVVMHSGYAITTLPRVLKIHPDPKSGHLKVSLCRDGIESKRWVHQLVLETFVGPMPQGLEGCHNDGDSSNNRVDNLRWDTHEENMRDARRHGTAFDLAAWKRANSEAGHNESSES